MTKELELIKSLIMGEFKPSSYDQKKCDKDPGSYFKEQITNRIGWAVSEIAQQEAKKTRFQTLLEFIDKIDWSNNA